MWNATARKEAGRALHQAGFTLVELLIVIAILAILASFGIVNHIAVLERARDGQRKADLLQMQAALELYRTDAGRYPEVASLTSCGGNLANGSVTYLRRIPCDPKGTTFYNGGIYPYGTDADGSTYWITACMENSNDSDTRVTTAPPTEAPTCENSRYFSVFNP